MEPHAYHAEARLRDDTPVVLRAIRPDDKQRLRDHFARLSEDSVFQRFFEPKPRLTDEDLRYFTELDFDRHFALAAAIREDGGEEKILGVGRGIDSGGGGGDGAVSGRTAEVAFAVADAYQGKGIGTLLLHHLAELARRLGYDRFEAWVLPGNGRMLDVFLHSGYRVHRRLEDGTNHVTFPLALPARGTGAC